MESTPDSPTAVILTAIPCEYAAVRDHLSNLEELTYKGNIYERGIFNGDHHRWIVGIAQVGTGNVMCAIGAERAIQFFNPKIIIFVGVAGGIKDLKLGDVVAADKAYGYEYGKVIKDGFVARPDVGLSTHALLERAKAEARRDDWKNRIKRDGIDKDSLKIIIKPIAAGEKVVSETRSEVFQFIKKYYNDSVAVEMEASGFYTACHLNEGIQSLIVRGISDLLDNKEESDSAGFQEIASKNASAFAFEVLSKYKIK